MRRDENLVLRACISATLVAAGLDAALAAENVTPTGRETIQEVVITGSYLDGAAEDAALPVTVINEQDIEKQGSPSILDLVRSLPASQATFGDSNAQQVFQGSGGVSANLRGLDAGRTLVLLNGRRLPISPVPLLGVDLNLLPLAAVGRIEVLKDGASSTYGSDAIAGVVNFITKRGFDGLAVEGSYTNIEDTDGDYTTSLVWGRNTDSFDFLFAAGYRHRSELQAPDRNFAIRAPARGVGGISQSGNPGAFIDLLGTPPAPGVPSIFLDPACASLGGIPVGGAVPSCNFKFTNFANIVEREEDYGAYGEFNTRLGEFADLHLEGFYTVHDTPEENASPSFGNTQGPGLSLARQFGLPQDPANPPTFLIPLTNPGLQALLPSLPAQTATNIMRAGAVVGNGLLFRTLGAGGNPRFQDEGLQRSRFFDAFRVSASLNGDIGNVGWDFALTYGENTNKIRTPLELPARTQLALAGFGGFNCTGTTPGANGCLFLNPFSTGVARNVITGQMNAPSGMGGTFNPATVNSREVIDFITGVLDLEETTDVFVADIVFNGDSGIKLPGGNITWALGAQYRDDGFERELSDISNRAITPCADSIINPAATCALNTGPFGFVAGFNRIDVSDDVYGVFTEFSLPLAEKLQAQLAFRYEDYGGRTGSTSNPKLALRYQATEWLTFRASASSTFRGPVLTQAQSDIITIFQFVPFFNAVRPFDTFTNPNLKPEEAENFNVGFLVNTEKLSLSLDYFQIKLEDKILNESGPDLVTTFFGTPQMPVNNCGRVGFEALQRRFTFTNGVCGINNLLRTRANIVNGPEERVKGLDYAASYNFTGVLGGNLLLGVDATYNLEYERDFFFFEGIRAPVAGGRDFAGTRGGIQAIPELRGSVFAEYNRSIHNLRITGRYVDGVTDLSAAAASPTGQLDDVASYFTTDIVYQLSLGSDLTVTGAVFNVADRDPPQVKNLDLNYDPFFYNPVGRAIKVGINKRF